MADVQPENGYTRIANQILESIVKLPLSGSQWRIVAVLWRNTYGYNRKEHGISETYIAKATGISKRFISSELRKLIDMKIIKVVKESTYTTPRVLMFNKNYDTWGYGTILPQVNDTSTGEQVFTSTVEQSFTSTGEQSFHQQKKNLKKELNKNEHNKFFESIWSLYPNKKGKAKVSDTQKAKLYKIGYEHICRCIERYKASKEDWKAWQHGSTFFNSGYVDYLDENYQEQREQKENYGVNLPPHEKYFD